MATSTVKLYAASSSAQWKLLPERLLKVESIEDYLASFTPKTINDFQYIKPELETAITVDLSQVYASPLMPSYKYVSIKNSDESTGKIYYYFVKKAVWRSQSAVRFELVMDVLNTFNETTDYVFKPSTKITREHKDRFIATGIKVVLKVSSIVGGVGSVSVGDDVTLRYYNSQASDWIYIGAGKYDFFNGDDVIITLDPDEDISSVREAIKTAIDYEETVQIAKDISNYLEIEIESPFSTNWVLFRKIDPVAEGINPVLQCGNAEGTLIEHPTTLLAQNWYLLYRNEENPMDDSKIVNPVHCYLIPENQTPVNNGVVSNGRITGNTLNANTWYYIRIPSGVTATLSNGETFTLRYFSAFLIVSKQENNKLSVTCCENSNLSPNNVVSVLAVYDDITYISFSSFPIPYYSTLTQLVLADYYSNIYGNETESFDEAYEGDYIDDISLLDRTDVKNIKLIKLPYCPYDFTVSGGKVNLIGTDWYFTTLTQANNLTINVIQLVDLNVKLNANFTKSSSPFANLYFGEHLPSIADLRQDYTYESKLYSSEFYRPTYIYDSFSFVMQLEKLDLSSYYSSRDLQLKFTMTSTINSKFMFTFSNYALARGEENYAKYMVISRNNEEVLYNIPYINYIRTGYNYEKKQKALELGSNLAGTGISAIGLGAALLMPSAPLKAAAVVGMVASFVNSTKNTIVSAIKSEEDLKQKLLQKKQEAASVEGSDDVDLMSEYAGNRIKYLEYKPTDLMRNLVFDLFYYAGYNSGRMGIPNHSTRYNFDYLECDAMFEKISAIPDDCLQELVNAFKNGVTYIHKTERVTDKWDIDQKYENWENSLL